MYQPYPMPNYGQFQQPYQQPYQMQSQPVLTQQTGIVGRIITPNEDIKPNEVPMDGSKAYFPIQDGSAIISKEWNRNGYIDTKTYIEVNENPDTSANSPTLFDVMNTLDNIQSMLMENKPATAKRTRKATQDDASE